MNNDAVRAFALQMINKILPPEKKADPNVQAMIRAIEQNDEQAGIRIATNLCSTYGVSKEDAVNDVIGRIRQMR